MREVSCVGYTPRAWDPRFSIVDTRCSPIISVFCNVFAAIKDRFNAHRIIIVIIIKELV